jgi:outer membrane protein OmpA-like peptidoglycan-associated protein
MPRRLSLITTILLSTWLHAQNLIPNGKLDSMNTCTEYKALCCPAGWFFTSRPRSIGKYEHDPYYLTMITFSSIRPIRNYWQTYLLCPLRPGARYRIQLKVAATYIGPNLHDIGFWFTDHFIISQGDSLLQPEKYIGFMDAKVQKLRSGWFQLEKEMTAANDDRVLVIGNFSRESNLQIAYQRRIQSADIYVTDLVLEPLDGKSCPECQHIQDSLYAIHRRHSDSTHPAPPTEEIDTPRAATPTQHIDTLRIPDIDFEFDSYHLADTTVLKAQRPLLEDKDISRILVAGYTDDKGTEAYNLNLSQQRAQEVARLLTEKFNIAADLITAEGRGISHQYKNDAANRRVEIYIYH